METNNFHNMHNNAMDQGEDLMGPEYWENRSKEEQAREIIESVDHQLVIPTPMRTMWQIDQEYLALMAYLMENEGEVDDEMMAKLDVVEQLFEKKATNYVGMIRMFEAFAEACKTQMDVAKRNHSRMTKAAEKMKVYLKEAMQLRELTKMELGTAKLSFRKSESVVVEDQDLLPKGFVTKKVELVPDKALIKTAIKSGEEVPGARIEVKANLMIQ